MKNIIIALVASLLLPVVGYSQSDSKKTSDEFYFIEVPNELKSNTMTIKTKRRQS
ncbi:MAG: hypothetical protein WBF83_12050 [Moheibacter sp.]